MNKGLLTPSSPETSSYRDLQILDELANNDALTQRDLSKRMGIALGLVNSYLKNLIAKGFITVKNIPSKRYAYYLTPNGFAEKSRLAYDLLSDYTRIYREAKNNYRKLFHELELDGAKRVIFAGADEVAEFAYITLQDTGLELTGIVDEARKGEKFFGKDILSINEISGLPFDKIVVTSYLKRKEIYQQLLDRGIDAKEIGTIFVTQ